MIAKRKGFVVRRGLKKAWRKRPRPSPIQLLNKGTIDYRRAGTHRRFRFDALMKFKRQADADRKAALAELAAHDQELGF